MTERPPRPAVDPDDTTLAPGEQAALDQSVRQVGARGRGVTIAAALFVLGLVCLIGGLLVFLREIYLATIHLRLGPFQ